MALPHIAGEVERLTVAALAKYEITAERVLREVSFGAFSRPGSFFDEDGETLTPPAEWPDVAAAAVQSFEVIERPRDGYFVPDADEESGRRYIPPHVERRYKVKLVDKTAHLTLLMRYLSLLTEKHEHTHTHTLEAIIGASMKPAGAAASPKALEARTGHPVEAPPPGVSGSSAPATLHSGPRDVELF